MLKALKPRDLTIVGPRLVLPRSKVPRLERAKPPVTIASGFRCSDGIVICADTLETVGDYGKRQQSKIVIKPAPNPTPAIIQPRRKTDPPVPVVLGPQCIAVFAGAGESDFIDRLVEYLWSQIEAVRTYADKVAAIEDGSIEFHQRYWPVYPSDQRPEAHVLVALWTPERIGLLKVIGPIVNEVNSYESVGFGVSLSKYVVDRLYQNAMSVSDASLVALYMLDQVKGHVQYCGGESQVLRLSGNGYTDFLWNFDIEWATSRFVEFDKALRPMLVAVGEMQISDEEFDKRLAAFMGRMQKMREDVIRRKSAIDAWADSRGGTK
jgi:hypothetical protein